MHKHKHNTASSRMPSPLMTVYRVDVHCRERCGYEQWLDKHSVIKGKSGHRAPPTCIVAPQKPRPGPFRIYYQHLLDQNYPVSRLLPIHSFILLLDQNPNCCGWAGSGPPALSLAMVAVGGLRRGGLFGLLDI